MKNKYKNVLPSMALFLMLINFFAIGTASAEGIMTQKDIDEAQTMSLQDKKVIIVLANRLDITDFENMSSTGKESEGFIGLMNIRGSNGTNDASSYASMGWGRKSYSLNKDLVFFESSETDKKEQYEYLTSKESLKINNLKINSAIYTNSISPYDSSPGILGEMLLENNIESSVIGNSDKEEPLSFAASMFMDSSGRVPYGNISDINISDNGSAFGIRTDYDRLLNEFETTYRSTANIIALELGDSYRLDEYRYMMNDEAYQKNKVDVLNNIDSFIKEVYEITSPEDTVIVASAFPSLKSYSEGYRLSPIFIKSENNSGLIISDSTRRPGIISNIDLSSYIFSLFGIEKPPSVSGHTINMHIKEDSFDFLNKDYDNIVALSKIRVPVLYTYAVFEMCIWIIVFASSFMYAKLHPLYIKTIRLILRVTLLFPLIILILPLFRQTGLVSSLVILILLGSILYALLIKYIRNDLDTIAILSFLTSIILLADMSLFGQYLIKNSLLGYDPIIGARFYGIGNEYMGVLVGASICTLSIIAQRYKLKNYILIPISLIVIFIMGNPSMGANVGGTITITAALIFFILKINNIKIDLKKASVILIGIISVVTVMAIIDFNSENKSHLAGTITNIMQTGPSAVIQIIVRKLSMNMKLISASIWSRVLILAIILMTMLFYRPFGVLKILAQKYPAVAKGWVAILAGSIIGFLVNDSGVVAAATGIGYIIVPMLLMLLNYNSEEKK